MAVKTFRYFYQKIWKNLKNTCQRNQVVFLHTTLKIESQIKILFLVKIVDSIGMKKLEAKYIVAIIISLIIGASILGYGYLDYKYKKEVLEQKIQSEEQEKIVEERVKIEEEADRFGKQQKYLECKMLIEQSQHEWWNRECKNRGLKEDCQLPFANGDRIREWAQKETDNCFKLIYSK